MGALFIWARVWGLQTSGLGSATFWNDGFAVAVTQVFQESRIEGALAVKF
jgi:hypothetical protein